MVTWTSRLKKKKKRNALDQAGAGTAEGTSLQLHDSDPSVAVAEGSENLIPAEKLPSAAAALAELFPSEEIVVQPLFGLLETRAEVVSNSSYKPPSFGPGHVLTDSFFEASVLAAFEAPAEPLVREADPDVAIADAPARSPQALPIGTRESFMDVLSEVDSILSHRETLTPISPASARTEETAETEARFAPPGAQPADDAKINAECAEPLERAMETSLGGVSEHPDTTSTGAISERSDQEFAPPPFAADGGSNRSGPPAFSALSSGAVEKANMPFLSEAPAAAPSISMAGNPGDDQGKQKNWEFEERLASHREWVESHGKGGTKADLASAELEGTELISVNLRFADLRDANLKATDLLLADLRDTSLMRANLQDACLVGANLEGANLEGASLETAMGLMPHQLAGTNLHEASLPQAILKFEAESDFDRRVSSALNFFVAMIAVSVLSWLAIWRTRDIQLIVNLSIFPFLHSPASAGAVPSDQFYLIAPIVLFIVYLVFQFHLQRLWDATLELPAVFPDGRLLGEKTPRLVMGLLRAHFHWLNHEGASTRILEKAGAMAAAYWVVPFTLLLFWARYLTLHDMHGTTLQVLLVAAAAGVAIYSTTRVGRPAEKWATELNRVERIVENLKTANPAALAIVAGIFLMLVSAGTVVGIPHESTRAPQYSASNIRRWGPDVLWAFGISPWASLNEAGISTAPADWSGTNDNLNLVKGARLDSPSFRYVEAYGIFLANAHLLHGDFQGAFLSAADLRGADLGQSNLRFAVLDQAQMNHTNLDRSNLEGANLGRADLRGANLSYCMLTNSFLLDAHLENAVLYQAQLTSATLTRANLEKADLRGARLDGANLDYADLQQAYLWSAKLAGAHLDNANLSSSIFIDADMTGADLRGAQFHGTVLNGANLTGTDLDGADLRGVSGLSSGQICSAKSRRWVVLNDALQIQVTAQCGAAR